MLRDLQRAVLGIEPRTSGTLSENHTTRPNSQVFDVVTRAVCAVLAATNCAREDEYTEANFVSEDRYSDTSCRLWVGVPCCCTCVGLSAHMTLGWKQPERLRIVLHYCFSTWAGRVIADRKVR